MKNKLRKYLFLLLLAGLACGLFSCHTLKKKHHKKCNCPTWSYVAEKRAQA